MSLSELEREMIISVLKECDGKIALASKKLKIGRSTLYRKMEKYGLLVMKTISE
jgi:transcriptional regulator of acetoin/glycerol metabolism